MMRARMVMAVMLLWATAPGVVGQALPTSEACRSCHLALDDDRLVDPAVSYEGDVHAEAGFGCLACHGAQVGAELEPSLGFLSAPERRRIPEMCGSCHSDADYMRAFDPGLRVDQVAEYWSSAHGRRLRDADDPDVATCTDCHVAHRIRPASDPASSVYPTNVIETCGRCHEDSSRMRAHDLPTDQLEQYAQSVHGILLLEDGDLSAPVCNDCHGNHGAAPPGVSSVNNVCGQCHAVMADYFAASGHPPLLEERGMAGCSSCHEHHAVSPVSDALLEDRTGAVCLECHEEGDGQGSEFLVIAGILDSLDAVVSEARETLEHAEDLGMEVSQALFELEDVGNARTRARSAVHTFSSGAVRDEVAVGLAIAAQAEQRGEEALAEHRFRRVGLGLSSLVIFLLITALLLKIRQIESVHPPTSEEHA